MSPCTVGAVGIGHLVEVQYVMCAMHISPTWTRGKSGNKDSETLSSRPGSFTRGRELGAANPMVIEEHQAEELGVQ